MKIPIISALFFLASAQCLSASASNLSENFKAALDAGSVRVKYRSTGCFHACVYELVFQLTDKFGLVVAVTEVEMNWGEDGKGMREVGRSSIGHLRLNNRDCGRLEAALKYYTKLPENSVSTTNDHLIFEGVKDGRIDPIADVEDHTGGLSSRLDVLSMEELIDRANELKSAKKPG